MNGFILDLCVGVTQTQKHDKHVHNFVLIT
jgi:hypothetical protein